MTTEELLALIEQDSASHRRHDCHHEHPGHPPVVTIGSLANLAGVSRCGACPRVFDTIRGRSLHMAQRHPAEWAAEGIATGKAAERAYFRDRKRAYVAANPERSAAYTKKWRASHPDKVRQTQVDWKADRADHVKAYQEAWRSDNREHVLEYAVARRLSGMAAPLSASARAKARRKSWAKDVLTGAAKARRAVAQALHDGSLVKVPCVVCGATRVEGHHFLGYAPEHRLDVRWLCKEHHVEAHNPEAVARRRRVADRLAASAPPAAPAAPPAPEQASMGLVAA